MSRRRTTTLLPAAGLLALVLTACGGSDTDDKKADEPSPTDETAAAVELQLPEQEPGRCAAPNAKALALTDTAFEGTVTQVDDVSATLQVDRWFTGGDADMVTVVLPGEEMVDRGFAVDFEEGKTYLVSATGGAVSLCGFTDESSADLEEIYVEAFPEE